MPNFETLGGKVGTATKESAETVFKEIESEIAPYVSVPPDPDNGRLRSEPKPYALQRAIRRLLALLDQRKLRDYDNLREFREEMLVRLAEIVSSAKAVKNGPSFVSELFDILQVVSDNEVFIQFKSEAECYSGALKAVQAQGDAISSTLSQQEARDYFYNWLAPAVSKVIDAWSSWDERYLPILDSAALGLIFGCELYCIVGLYIPTPTLAVIPLLCAIRSGLGGKTTRDEALNRGLVSGKETLKQIDPDSNDPLFWKASTPSKVLDRVLSDIRKQQAGISPSGQASARGRSALILLCAIVPIVAVVLWYVQRPPIYEIIGLPSAPCENVIAHGHTLWNGPFDVVVVNVSASGWTADFVQREKIGAIHRVAINGTSAVGVPCVAMQASKPSVQTVKILFPFQAMEIHTGSEKPEAEKLAEAETMLRAWIEECGARVAVVGAASEKPFQGDAGSKNNRLSYDRGTFLAQRLGLPSNAVVGTDHLFRSLKEDSNDATERMARTPFIELTDAKKCEFEPPR